MCKPTPANEQCLSTLLAERIAEAYWPEFGALPRAEFVTDVRAIIERYIGPVMQRLHELEQRELGDVESLADVDPDDRWTVAADAATDIDPAPSMDADLGPDQPTT